MREEPFYGPFCTLRIFIDVQILRLVVNHDIFLFEWVCLVLSVLCNAAGLGDES